MIGFAGIRRGNRETEKSAGLRRRNGGAKADPRAKADRVGTDVRRAIARGTPVASLWRNTRGNTSRAKLAKFRAEEARNGIRTRDSVATRFAVNRHDRDLNPAISPRESQSRIAPNIAIVNISKRSRLARFRAFNLKGVHSKEKNTERKLRVKRLMPFVFL